MSETQRAVETTTQPPAEEMREASPLARTQEARTPEVLPMSSGAPPTPVRMTFRSSPTIGQFIAALAKAQLEFGPIERGHTALVESKRTGGKYSYDYADLDAVLGAVRDACARNGIAILQPPLVGQKSVTVTTILALGGTEEFIQNDLSLAIESLDPQSIGSAITYARRYSLQSLLGVAPASDDDAAAAMPRKNGNGNGHKPATVPMPERASVQSQPPPNAIPTPPPPATGFLLTACVKKTPPNHTVYWSATWRGKDVVAFDEVGQALEQAFRANRPIKELRTHEKHASVGNKVFIHVDEIVFAGGGQ